MTVLGWLRWLSDSAVILLPLMCCAEWMPLLPQVLIVAGPATADSSCLEMRCKRHRCAQLSHNLEVSVGLVCGLVRVAFLAGLAARADHELQWHKKEASQRFTDWRPHIVFDGVACRRGLRCDA